MKKQYETPELERLGTVSELSAGGSSADVEGGDSGGMLRRA